jgi:hypothetical protein
LVHAILKEFKTNDVNLPIAALLNALAKDKRLLHQIHPTKMEELAQSVLSDFFNCEVMHVGKAGDGGKDLIVIQKDEPILVQVKRRSKENAVESVSTVRDILGTIYRKF